MEETSVGNAQADLRFFLKMWIDAPLLRHERDFAASFAGNSFMETVEKSFLPHCLLTKKICCSTLVKSGAECFF